MGTISNKKFFEILSVFCCWEMLFFTFILLFINTELYYYFLEKYEWVVRISAIYEKCIYIMGGVVLSNLAVMFIYRRLSIRTLLINAVFAPCIFVLATTIYLRYILILITPIILFSTLYLSCVGLCFSISKILKLKIPPQKTWESVLIFFLPAFCILTLLIVKSVFYPWLECVEVGGILFGIDIIFIIAIVSSVLFYKQVNVEGDS
ncbi:MAG: hypothetical protein V2A78_13140 [bacterium]